LDKLAVLEGLMHRARGLILDFDGFLADSEKYHYLAYSEVFARYGHTIDETEYYKYWTSLGLGAKGEIERHKLDLDPLRIREEKVPIFSRYCRDGSIELFPEAKELLEVLTATGKTLAIASGSFAPDIRAVLENAGVEDCFEAILGSDTVPAIKPAPDVFLKTLDVIGLDAVECVVFEDAEKGMFAAFEAGMPVVIVLNEQTRGFDFSRADLVADSLGELVDLSKRATR
jgi:HAD superfamily hydrolase (TIGR01509 family)